MFFVFYLIFFLLLEPSLASDLGFREVKEKLSGGQPLVTEVVNSLVRKPKIKNYLKLVIYCVDDSAAAGIPIYYSSNGIFSWFADDYKGKVQVGDKGILEIQFESESSVRERFVTISLNEFKKEIRFDTGPYAINLPMKLCMRNMK